VNTLVDVFRHLETRRGEFLVHDDGYRVRRYSYQAVTRASRGFAARLSSHGIRKGDHILIWGENRAEWIAAYWGVQLIGAVAVPIDFRSQPAFAARIRDIVSARLVLAGDEVDSRDLQAWRLADLDWAADAPLPDVAIDPDDVAQIMFTSGATAEPKGVLIRHRNILANLRPVAGEIEKYKKYARPFQPVRFLNLLPLSHMFGQAMATTIPPLLNGTVVFMRSYNPHDIVRRVKEWKISVIVCVPKILEVLQAHAHRIDPAAANPPGGLSIWARWWRYRRVHRWFGLKFWAFVVGAAPLSPALEDFWKRLGFVVIQGYGLTETAPIVTLNHPFKTRTGSVGSPIAGVEVRIADDGEVLVRGDNVTTGYYGAGAEATRDAGGWLHTGDVGELDRNGRLFIRGRKKEMIVTPDGLNVFPDDVERVLNAQPGVVETAVVGAIEGATERVHAVLVLQTGGDAEAVVRDANSQLSDHQRVRSFSIWPEGRLPRTEGTQKLKRTAIQAWVASGTKPAASATADPLAALLSKFAGSREMRDDTSIEALGLGSLERVELMVALEDAFQTRIDETRFAGATTLSELRAVVTTAAESNNATDGVDFPAWNRWWLVRWLRRASQFTWLLPLTRMVAWAHVDGLEHLKECDGPVVFAANHQSHLDVPIILAAMPGRWRARVAPAMSKEFFKAHFSPAGHTRLQVLKNRLNYYLAAFFFNAFPLPQRQAGAGETLRYIGELASNGTSVLIFPEGVRTATGAIRPFQPGVGMIGARMDLPVVPIRLAGVDRVLPTGAAWPRPGSVSVTFGRPIRLTGEDYAALARQVEQAVRDLPIKGGA
jgi:long-chain acyl-CoA synthetase